MSFRGSILNTQGQYCARCFVRFRKGKLTVHHIRPQRLRGGNATDNLVLLCRRCHDHVEKEIKGGVFRSSEWWSERKQKAATLNALDHKRWAEAAGSPG